MKLDLSARMLCQIKILDTLGVFDILEHYLCSHQTKLDALSQNKLSALQS